MSGPLVPNPSTVSRNMMHITDWFPTIMRLAGGSVSNLTLDGFEQWDAINGKRASPRKVRSEQHSLIGRVYPIYLLQINLCL